MRQLLVGSLVSAVLVGAGSLVAVDRPERDTYYGSPEPILPMTFAHSDHVGVNCLNCHHNFRDETGRESCMYCHVTRPKVAPLMEAQFHDLCRSCHVERQLEGEPAGPTRRCLACHLGDDESRSQTGTGVGQGRWSAPRLCAMLVAPRSAKW